MLKLFRHAQGRAAASFAPRPLASHGPGNADRAAVASNTPDASSSARLAAVLPLMVAPTQTRGCSSSESAWGGLTAVAGATEAGTSASASAYGRDLSSHADPAVRSEAARMLPKVGGLARKLAPLGPVSDLAGAVLDFKDNKEAGMTTAGAAAKAGGGWAGAAAGAAAGARLPVPHPVAKFVGTLGGALVGSGLIDKLWPARGAPRGGCADPMLS